MLMYKHSYIIEDTNGTRRYIYYEPGEGINCIIRASDTKESSPVNVVNNGSDDFSADIEGDYIYLLYKDVNNELNLMIWNGSVWSQSPLMKSRITGSIKYPNIFLDSGFIHIFYENVKNNSCYLVHHFWNRNKWSSNVIVNSGNSIWYQFAKSPAGLYGIYSENGKLMYLNFSYTSGTWTKPNIVGNTDGKDNLFIHADSKYNNTHIIYSADEKLHYVRKTSGNWPSNEEQNKVLYSGNAQYPSIFNIGGNLWTTWFSDGFIYTCLSADNGDTWSKPFKISSEIDTLSTCRFISLKKSGLNHIHAFYHTKNPYYLILIDDIFDPHSSGFSYFTFYINQMQQYIDQLSSKLQEQKNKNNDLIKNMQKIEIYYKDLSTQYSLLKSSYGNLLREVNNLKSDYENIKSENINLKKELEKSSSSLLKKFLFQRRS